MRCRRELAPLIIYVSAYARAAAQRKEGHSDACRHMARGRTALRAGLRTHLEQNAST